jgi:hypothetical protein
MAKALIDPEKVNAVFRLCLYREDELVVNMCNDRNGEQWTGLHIDHAGVACARDCYEAGGDSTAA